MARTISRLSRYEYLKTYHVYRIEKNIGEREVNIICSYRIVHINVDLVSIVT